MKIQEILNEIDKKCADIEARKNRWEKETEKVLERLAGLLWRAQKYHVVIVLSETAKNRKVKITAGKVMIFRGDNPLLEIFEPWRKLERWIKNPYLVPQSIRNLLLHIDAVEIEK